jgi:cephalosporin hydroxylase
MSEGTATRALRAGKLRLRRSLLEVALRHTPVEERRARALTELPADDPRLRQLVIERFNQLYYAEGRAGGTWHRTEWLGVTTWKCPLDLWVYQELLHRLRPDLIIETGTAYGGSALYLAGVCEALGKGQVVSVDIDPQPGLPSHRRAEFVRGSSTDPGIVAGLAARAAAAETVLVILDADHSAKHVRAELDAYGPLVTPGSYLIVEDTNVNGHPAYPEHGPGPYEAVEAFLAELGPDSPIGFERDPDCEKFHLTFNPGGWLRRVR